MSSMRTWLHIWINKEVRRLSASVTWLDSPQECFTTKLNCWRNVVHVVCIWESLSWLLRCFNELSARKCIFIIEKSSFYTLSLTNIPTFMYSSSLWFNYVCFIIIKYFMYFRGHHGHFTMNERSDSKTDSNFGLRTVENLRRSIKR